MAYDSKENGIYDSNPLLMKILSLWCKGFCFNSSAKSPYFFLLDTGQIDGYRRGVNLDVATFFIAQNVNIFFLCLV